MLAICLKRTFAIPRPVLMEVREAADVHHPEIHRRFTLCRPLRQHPASTAARSNAEGVEACTNIEVLQFRRRPEDEIAIGREAFRPIDHLLDACLGEGRNTRQRFRHVLLEMIPVILEKLELEVARNIARGPRDGIGLITPEDKPADLFLEIGAPVRVAQRGGVGGKALNLLGDDILVLHRLKRHGNARHGADLPRPLATTVDDCLAGDHTVIGADRAHPAVRDIEAFDAAAFHDLRPVHTGALGE